LVTHCQLVTVNGLQPIRRSKLVTDNWSTYKVANFELYNFWTIAIVVHWCGNFQILRTLFFEKHSLLYIQKYPPPFSGQWLQILDDPEKMWTVDSPNLLMIIYKILAAH